VLVSSSKPLIEAEAYVSRLRPPWFVITIPSNPYFTASTASSAVWTPLATMGSFVDLRSHAISSQLKVSSIYPPMVRPRPPPLVSFVAVAPLIAALANVADSTLTRSSPSRLPCTGPSIVNQTPLIPFFSASLRSASEADRSLLTYS
jgi:hypothetical protein